MSFSSNLDRGSSPVDWCEDNYSFSPFIAEFVNTVSNVLFLVMTPFLIRLHIPYAARMGPGIHLIWTLLFVVGVSSAYFHATLSLVGQLLDEIAILWLLMTGFALWYPAHLLPECLRDTKGRKTFSLSVCFLTTLSTLFGFWAPALNAFFLMMVGIPAVCLLFYNLRRESLQRVISLGKRSIAFWILAVTCWMSDKLLCDIWSTLGFPYLHGFWHIFIFLAAYTGVVLFAYFDVKNHWPKEEPMIRYWPDDSFEFGIPFVLLKSKVVSQKDATI